MMEDSAVSDVVIAGAGIVGLATALALAERRPRATITVLEKEPGVGRHQTGHNSGVIHSGIYYRPQSLKARLCVEGVARLKHFCRTHGIPYEDCGKVIVAVSEDELPRLEALYRQGQANGVPGLELIDDRALRRIEPHARGLAALHSPETAIVDYRTVAGAIARLLAERGVRLVTGARLTALETAQGLLEAVTPRGRFRMALLVNCAGLYSDSVARLAGLNPPVRIMPFRGEYYRLRPERAGLVRGLIYPVPNPRLPFLGVHLTRTIHGEVEAGPNALLAFAREGYRLGRVNPGELWDVLTYPGFWTMARRWWRVGIEEFVRSVSSRSFARAVRRLLPEIRQEDLVRAGAGVRAQAVDEHGNLVDDFVIMEGEASLHVLNAPSPAATASLAIGHYIAGLIADRLG
ncbi:MAG: L-2-hydroxyglutarate oxidase [Firmicutes bacterium]|nr:L-2-hydroxyglutarate oxidase [Bacillota bacterium]